MSKANADKQLEEAFEKYSNAPTKNSLTTKNTLSQCKVSVSKTVPISCQFKSFVRLYKVNN